MQPGLPLTQDSDYVTKNIDYLRTQVGNPEGPNKPNKKKYDPRVCVHRLRSLKCWILTIAGLGS
jgi:hypothetical protein